MTKTQFKHEAATIKKYMIADSTNSILTAVSLENLGCQ